MKEAENTISNKPSPQEMERRLKVLADAKKLPQAKNIKRLAQGESTDYNRLKDSLEIQRKKKKK